MPEGLKAPEEAFSNSGKSVYLCKMFGAHARNMPVQVVVDGLVTKKAIQTLEERTNISFRQMWKIATDKNKADKSFSIDPDFNKHDGYHYNG